MKKKRRGENTEIFERASMKKRYTKDWTKMEDEVSFNEGFPRKKKRKD